MANENINPKLEPLCEAVSVLHLDPENARKHSGRSTDGIQASLKEYGQQKPIVALDDGTVIAGNGTLMAAKAMGWERIAVVRFADREKARAYAIADNRTAELSEWDEGVLAAQLQKMSAELEGFDPSKVGYTEAEMEAVIAKAQGEVVVEVPPQEPLPQGDGASAPPAPEAPPSHVRMVQLFLSESSHPPFMDRVKQLAAVYGTQTVTDTVERAIQEAHAARIPAAS